MLRTVILTCVLLAPFIQADPEVFSISPTAGSVSGGTRLTIFGQEFSKDKFSFGAGNTNKGNLVSLVATDSESHTCAIHTDGNTETMITCDTPSGLTHNKYFYVRVKVDGVDIPTTKTCAAAISRCGFRGHNWWTPTITEFSQTTWSVADVNVVPVTGRIVTDKYGSEKAQATNGLTQSFKRVYYGGSSCELKDANSQMYGMALDDAHSYNGYFKCRLTGTFIGYSKFAFIIDNPYGRSLVNTEEVSVTDSVYHIQVYSEVKSLSLNVGSTEGNTTVVVDGYYFEDGSINAHSSYSNMTFLIAGVPCKVVNVVKNGQATVWTPAQSLLPALTKWPGNRGMYVEYWTSGSFATNADIRDATTAATGTVFLDQMYFSSHTLLSTAYTRAVTFFKAPHDGLYAFYVRMSNGGELYINGTSRAASTGGWSTKGKIQFTKNTYSELILVAKSGTDATASVEVKYRFYNTKLLNSKTMNVQQERWRIELRSPIKNEEVNEKMSSRFREGGLCRLIQDDISRMDALMCKEAFADMVTTLEWENVVPVQSRRTVQVDPGRYFSHVMRLCAKKPLLIWHEPIQNNTTVNLVLSDHLKDEYDAVYKKGGSLIQEWIKPSGFTSQTHTKEIQKVCPTGGLKGKLCLYGVCTLDAITFSSPTSTIETALNKLPFLATTESFSVAADGTCFDITFNSKRGNIPPITTNTAGVTVTTTESTAGVPDNLMFSLMYGGIPSALETFDDSDKTVFADKLKGMFLDVFSTRCPAIFTAGEGFETGTSSSIVTDTIAFCGRNSYKNPSEVFPVPGTKTTTPRLTLKPWICLAVKDLDNDNIYINYETPSGRVRNNRKFSFTSASVPTSEGGWKYTCVDLLQNVKSENSAESGDNYLLVKVFFRQEVAADFYVDDIVLGLSAVLTIKTDTDLTSVRLLPGSPNPSTQVLVKDAAVVYDTTSQRYGATLTVHDCGSSLDLLTLANADSTGSKTFPSTTVTSTLEGGTAHFIITSKTQATPALAGKFKLVIGSETTSAIDAQAKDEVIQKDIESSTNIGKVKVTTSSASNCATRDVSIELSDLAGDQTLGSLSNVALTAPAGATATLVEERDGHLENTHVKGDYLRTAHSTPQLEVTVNGVPSKCKEGVDCSFAYSAASTPSIATVSPTSGSSGVSITITGTLLGSTAIVYIGGVACVVTASSGTTVTCTVGDGPIGPHTILLVIPTSGKASGTVNFEYTSDLTTISPVESGLAGGIPVTLTGFGFSADSKVYFDTIECPKVGTPTVDKIVCTVPAYPTPATVSTDQAVTVKVEKGTTTMATTKTFTYQASVTPTITTLTIPNPLHVAGGETVSIVGTNFGANPTLSIGGTPCVVTAHTTTTLTATTPILAPGVNLPVELNNGNGVALMNNAVPSATVKLAVKNMFPRSGSVIGGTRITLTGEGFGSVKADAEIYVGDTQCAVDTIADTQIVCDIQSTGKCHYVSNLAPTDIYYAFNVTALPIEVEDCVKFTWDHPDFMNDVVRAVYQVDSVTTSTKTTDGIDSGTPVRSGMFKYCFNKAGTYILSSGKVDKNGLRIYYMTVTVSERSSKFEALSVKVKGQTADYTLNGASDPSSTGCAILNSDIASCSPATVTPANANLFNFEMRYCRTPMVDTFDFTSIDANQRTATGSTVFTVTGKGFSDSNACTNEAKIGDCSCTVTPVSSTQFTCVVDAACSLNPIAQYIKLSLTVGGYGFAQINIATLKARSAALLPEVKAISPTSISLVGGTKVTVTGSGLSATTLVKVDGTAVDFTESAGTLTVTTGPTLQTSAELTVHAGTLQAKCSTSNDKCALSPTSAQTPTITTVSPSDVSGSTVLTMTGTMFGTAQADLSLTIGGEVCAIQSPVTTTSFTCQIAAVPAGSHAPILTVEGLGNAKTSKTVTGLKTVSAVGPTEGSTSGGTELVFSGHGFNGVTSVSDGTVSICKAIAVTLTQVTCTSLPHAAGAASVVITSNGDAYPAVTYTFADASTPKVTAATPTISNGDTLTITGSGFGTTTSSVHVYMENNVCAVTAVTDTEVQCTVGVQSSGAYAVAVLVDGKGFSTNGSTTYQIRASSIDPTTGSTLGQQLLTITGAGFTSMVIATVCNNPCTFSSVSSSSYVCVTPVGSVGNCDVKVQDGPSATALTAGTYAYAVVAVPTAASVIPTNGGTGGGTVITLTGTGLSGTSISVSINGVACAVNAGSSTSTQIVCTTGQHTGTVSAAAVITVDGSRAVGVVMFRYVDRWSSPATWGNSGTPQEGELIVIPKGQDILMDVNTPILAMLLVEGTLSFDEDVADLTLNAKIILVTNGGTIQAGTEESPYTNTLTITLHGNSRDPVLPIYGSKVVAIRDGSLKLHGIPVTTWARLTSTAAAGSSELNINIPAVGWKVGDEVVVATTGEHDSQKETETRTVSAISADKKRITLSAPLTYTHTSQTDFECTLKSGSKLTRDLSGEAGLLSRNIKVVGSSNSQWSDTIEACPDGFDTGEFATQTCFQGRFGEEVGSDQFGVQILIHPAEKDTNAAKAQLSFVEVTYAGQAFQLGRYPVHFHLGGDMSYSYVNGCSIHTSFNRAVNIHGTRGVNVLHTVVYNIMGGAFFLEDGIETGNTYKYNLAVFVKSSSSLLNDDITPAAFWATNPNNTYIGNAAAGGTHFAWWYRMLEHPEGPSHTTSVCPRKVPLGIFSNNTAHSNGWFGLWIFQDYYPVEGGSCSGTTPKVAVFSDFTTYHNEKGVEFVNYANLQVEGHVSAREEKTAFEGKQDVSHGCLSPTIKDSCYVGKKTASETTATPISVKHPYGTCFQMENVAIVDIPLAFEYTEIQGTCSVWCGGFISRFSGLLFTNVANIINWRWVHEGIMIDTDGSLGGVSTQGCRFMPYSGTHIPTSMLCSSTFGRTSVGLTSQYVSSSVDFLRLAFKDISPASLQAKNVTMTSKHGTTFGYFNDKRLTEKPGVMVTLVEGQTYKLEFENAPLMTNVSFSGGLYGLKEGHCIIIGLKVAQTPDKITTDGTTYKNASATPFDCSTASIETGDWYVSADFAYFAFKGPEPTTSSARRKRSGPSIPKADNDLHIAVKVEKCFYENCDPPHNPDTDPPIDARPNDWDEWDDTGIWTVNADGAYVTRTTSTPGTAGLPVADSDVIISSETAGANWVVIKNYNPPDLGNVLVYGGLEIDYASSYTYTFKAKNIIIFGGRYVVGWPNNPVLGTASIVLRGDQNSPWYTGVDGYNIGNKAIAAFGGFDAHGTSKGHSWVRLGATAAAGSRVLSLETGANVAGWLTNDEVVLTTTSPNPKETEHHTIASVDASARTVTLKDDLLFTHAAITENVNGRDIVFAAALGLLTRNVKVSGEPVTPWGGRVFASVGQMGSEVKTGFVRATNVEFMHMGQEGFIEPKDPRFAVALLGTGYSAIRPSEVTNCAFHHLYNSAIGLFGSDDIALKRNVVSDPVGNGIVAASDGVTLEGNLVANQLWRGSYNGRNEVENIDFDANIKTIGATDLTLKDNYVAGAERLGYRVAGENCAAAVTKYSNNFAVGCLMGVNTFNDDDITVEAGQTCTRWSGFRTWRNVDYGIYYNNGNELQVTDVVTADEQTGMFMFIVGPSALGHVCSEKVAEITNSTFIGTLSNQDCSGFTKPSGTYYSNAAHCRGQRSGLGGRLGVIAPVFSQGPNNSPLKPCGNIMAYNAECGKTTMSDNTFKNFGPHSTCGASFALAFSPLNDDANHGLYIRRSTPVNIDSAHAVLIPRPNIGRVNTADCVDMDCDAMKQALAVDEDGTLLGVPTSVIGQSEYEWDGDARRGYGDYRIPKAMLTDLEGNRKTVESIADGKGNYRTSTCTFVPVDNSGSWRCPNSKYELLLMASMDVDTEVRRLSPVAVLNDRYMDLVNGPQDHGWCSGYTCRLRLSTFIILVAPGLPTDIYLSSTEPEKMRFFMIHGSSSSCLVISFFFTNPNRIDVFDEDSSGAKSYVLPKNGQMVDGQFSYVYGGTPDSYKPTCNDPHGANYIDKQARLVYFVLKGSRVLHLERAKVLVLALSVPMTEAEFFASNLIQNLASLLNIRLDKIRVAKVVAESSSSGRRRRSANGITVTVEIGDDPSGDDEKESNAATTVENDVTPLAETLANACQDGSLESSLGTSNVGCQAITVNQTEYTLAVPSTLRFETSIVPQHENVPFATQPQIRAYDSDDNVVPSLGVESAMWEVTATLRSGLGHASAVLSGQTTVTAVGGWLNFTDLAISHAGSGYIVDFEITAPSSATALNLTVPSVAFTVAGLPMVAGLNSLTTGYITQSNAFSMTLDLRDNTTNDRITNITWRGHTFSTNCGLVFSPEIGNLTGTLTKPFDASTGTVLFNDLAFSGTGLVIIACQVESDPAEYSFTHYQEIMVYTTEQAAIVTEDTSVTTLRFAEDYYTTLPTEAAEKQFLMAVIQKLTAANTRIVSARLEPGSILVIFTIEGSTVSVTEMKTDLCSNVSAGITVTVGSVTLTMDSYMTVDGVDYFATCGTTPSSDDDDGLHPGFIALIAVLCAIVLVLLVLLLLWKFKVLPKTKTHGETNGDAAGNRYPGGFYYIDNGRTVFLAGPNQRVEDIFYKQKNGGMVRQSSDMAPPVTTLYDDLEMNNATTRHSPLPQGGLYKDWSMARAEN